MSPLLPLHCRRPNPGRCRGSYAEFSVGNWLRRPVPPRLPSQPRLALHPSRRPKHLQHRRQALSLTPRLWPTPSPASIIGHPASGRCRFLRLVEQSWTLQACAARAMRHAVCAGRRDDGLCTARTPALPAPSLPSCASVRDTLSQSAPATAPHTHRRQRRCGVRVMVPDVSNRPRGRYELRTTTYTPPASRLTTPAM